MKKILYSYLFSILSFGLQAQQTDFNRVVQPIEMKARDFREFLVQLAWLNQPENAVVQEEVKIAEEELKLTNKSWLNDVQLSFNLNEANLRGTTGGGTVTNTVTQIERVDNLPPVTRITTTTEPVPVSNNVFFPRYNLGLNFNIGTISTLQNKKNIKARELAITKHEVNQQKLVVRAEVLQRYEKLLLANAILRTRTQLEQDAQSNFLLISQLYKTDDRTFEDFNEANSVYTNAQESRMKAESEVQLAKYALEELIGIRWEEVIHSQKVPN